MGGWGQVMRDYWHWIAVLCELIGMHPRLPEPSEHLLEVLRRWGWRPFIIEHYGR